MEAIMKTNQENQTGKLWIISIVTVIVLFANIGISSGQNSKLWEKVMTEIEQELVNLEIILDSIKELNSKVSFKEIEISSKEIKSDLLTLIKRKDSSLCLCDTAVKCKWQITNKDAFDLWKDSVILWKLTSFIPKETYFREGNIITSVDYDCVRKHVPNGHLNRDCVTYQHFTFKNPVISWKSRNSGSLRWCGVETFESLSKDSKEKNKTITKYSNRILIQKSHFLPVSTNLVVHCLIDPVNMIVAEIPGNDCERFPLVYIYKKPADNFKVLVARMTY